MLILWKHFETKMKKICQIERMLHCVKIDKLKKMTLYLSPWVHRLKMIKNPGYWNACVPKMTSLRKKKRIHGLEMSRLNWKNTKFCWKFPEKRALNGSQRLVIYLSLYRNSWGIHIILESDNGKQHLEIIKKITNA